KSRRIKQKGPNRSLGLFRIWSGRRVSNSRPQPWQGCALPTELLPHVYCLTSFVAVLAAAAKKPRIISTLFLPRKSFCLNFNLNFYLNFLRRIFASHTATCIQCVWLGI